MPGSILYTLFHMMQKRAPVITYIFLRYTRLFMLFRKTKLLKKCMLWVWELGGTEGVVYTTPKILILHYISVSLFMMWMSLKTLNIERIIEEEL